MIYSNTVLESRINSAIVTLLRRWPVYFVMFGFASCSTV